MSAPASGLAVSPPLPASPVPAASGTPGPHVVVVVGNGSRNVYAVHGPYDDGDQAADAASGILAGQAGMRAEIHPCRPPVLPWSLGCARPGDVVRPRLADVAGWRWVYEPSGDLPPWLMVAGPEGFVGQRSTSTQLAPLDVKLVTRGTGAGWWA